ncbi:uncharacterized protein [Triticum aestivum]|uniref:uncharacterized protein n=1 Tax=Triticum aestivum TaxID=4565 RepID=UPI001D0176D7|nr:uncharacterized protein LOC123153813 [Triticum aestivum]
MDCIERPGLGSHRGRVDRISALSDDLLVLLLARLRCAAAAARTSVLSRRWRGLWTHLRQIVFRGVALPFLEAAAGRVSPAVSLLEIHVPVPVPVLAGRLAWLEPAGIRSLLCAAARTAPEEFVLVVPRRSIQCAIDADLPCFHRATSIVLDSLFLLRVPDGVEFPVLETLSLTGCIVVDLDALLSRCPRLRVFRLKMSRFYSDG